jgi:hypothetical protein
MRKIAAISITTLLALTLLATSATASSAGWSDASAYGSVSVSADRNHITVCDTASDGVAVSADYATSYLSIYTVKDPHGADGKCAHDSTFFSRITVFKLCFKSVGMPRICNPSIWISRVR